MVRSKKKKAGVVGATRRGRPSGEHAASTKQKPLFDLTYVECAKGCERVLFINAELTPLDAV